MAANYEIVLCPPVYPDRQHPWTCKHDPIFKLEAGVAFRGHSRGTTLEIYHYVCFACGRSLVSTVGGNVLVDLQMILESPLGSNARIARRCADLRDRWLGIALKLFGPDGWNGRHERVARLIDRRLTMRISGREDGPGGVSLVRVLVDTDLFYDPVS